MVERVGRGVSAAEFVFAWRDEGVVVGATCEGGIIKLMVEHKSVD